MKETPFVPPLGFPFKELQASRDPSWEAGRSHAWRRRWKPQTEPHKEMLHAEDTEKDLQDTDQPAEPGVV